MPEPIIPSLAELANIRNALNKLYYGQDIPTEVPSQGLYKEFNDIRSNVTTINTTLGNRKPPKLIAQASAPPNPNGADNQGGLWINTSPSVDGPTATLIYYWNSTTSAWEAISGKVSESVDYNWTGKHTLKNTLNYFANNAARDAAFTSPAAGWFALVGNKLQLHDASAWRDISLPAAGAAGQAIIKNSATDFDVVWADIVRPAINNTLSGANTFSGINTFSAKPNFNAGIQVAGAAGTFGAGIGVTGTSTLQNTSITGTLSVSSTATLQAITASSTLTVTGNTTLNSKTSVKSGSSRDDGFFIGTARVWVSASQPAGAVTGDIWIQV